MMKKKSVLYLSRHTPHNNTRSHRKLLTMKWFIESLVTNSIAIQYWHLWLSIAIILLSIRLFIKKSTTKTKINENVEHELGSEFMIGNENIDDIEDKNYSTIHNPNLKHIPYLGIKQTLPGGANKFYEIANDRRSIRKFSKKSIDLKTLKTCILAAATSPSGAHTEPWTFCIVSNKEVKEKIREIIEAEELLNYRQRMGRQWTDDLIPFKTNNIKEYLTDAPYLVLIFKQTYGIRSDGTKQPHYYHEISTAIATGILLSAFQCAGLNSLVTTPLNCGPALRTLLNRPINEKLLVLLPVGLASDDCFVPDIKRKNINEIIVEY